MITDNKINMRQLFITNKNYSSWSLRPWVLMRELDIPFVERLEAFSGQGRSDFERFSPSGKVPCLIDGDTVVWDSLGITEYLTEQNPRVWPADAAARTWARCAAAEMHSGFHALRERCTMNCGVRVKYAALPADLQKDLARLDGLWTEGISRFGGPYLAGPAFTAVDAFFAPVAFRVQTYSLDLAPTSRLYVQRLLELPAMQDWYASALTETGRHEKYEQITKDAGIWLNDYRAIVS